MRRRPDRKRAAPRTGPPQRPEPSEERDLDPAPGDCAAEAACKVLRRHFGRMLDNERGARLGADPVPLHDMRVASLRLRAALRVFRDVLPPRRAARFDRDLKWVRDALGRVRDLDVYLAHLRTQAAAMPPHLRPALGVYFDGLHAQRARARAGMLRALASQRYRRFVAAVRRLLRAGPPRSLPAAAGRPVEEAARDVITERLGKVQHRGRAARPHSTDTELHELRIRCKRLRYACEFFEGLLGAPATEFIARLKRIQDALGENQDSVVAREKLREFAATLPAHREADGGLGEALAWLVAAHEERARRAREEFFREWRGFDSAETRAPILSRLGIADC